MCEVTSRICSPIDAATCQSGSGRLPWRSRSTVTRSSRVSSARVLKHHRPHRAVQGVAPVLTKLKVSIGRDRYVPVGGDMQVPTGENVTKLMLQDDGFVVHFRPLAHSRDRRQAPELPRHKSCHSLRSRGQSGATHSGSAEKCAASYELARLSRSKTPPLKSLKLLVLQERIELSTSPLPRAQRQHFQRRAWISHGPAAGRPYVTKHN